MKKRIINFIKKNDDTELIHKTLSSLHPADLSSIFIYFEKPEREKVYLSLNNQELSLLFSYIKEPEDYLIELPFEKINLILEEMDIDDLNYLLNSITDDDLRISYIKSLNPKKQQEFEYISKINEDRVGKLISKNYISLDSKMEIKEAMKTLITKAGETDIIDPLFVQQNGKLIGTISLNDLIIARSPQTIENIVNRNLISLDVNDSIIDATAIIKNYSLNALPVLDNNIFIGIITSDDILEIYSDVFESQYTSLAGIKTSNDKRFFNRLIERLPWLLIILLFSLVTTNIMANFEGIIKQVTILVLFQTLILDMAGNVGTQSLAVTIQTLIYNDKMTKKEIRNHLLKELKINIINSLFLFIIAFLVSFIFLNIYKTDYSKILISLTISLSMGLSLVIASFFGTIIPIILKRLNINPSIASGPLITTINDVISILIYFNIATLFLNLIV